MTNTSQKTLNPEIATPQGPTPWWNRGIFHQDHPIGKWFHKLFGSWLYSKQTVTESTLFLYNRAMIDIRLLGKNAEIIDNEKFGKEEFLIFVKLKYLLRKNVDEYANLEDSIQLLQLAIDAKDSFIAIYQTELSFRGSKQQDFYQHVESLLKDYENTEVFRDNVQVSLTESLNQIKTEEGRVALQAYSQHLNRLSERDLGLKLLSLFKAYQMGDYSILKRISDIIQSLDKTDLQSYNTLMSLVMANYDAFEKIRKIINLPQEKSNPDIYCRMMQYIALNYRYGLSFMKFDELMGVLRRWYRPYQTIIAIREAHPPHQFQQPLAFQEPILGEATYFKYLKWLTDKKTGMVYVDFDSEEE